LPHRILTPAGHGDETLAIAHELLPPGYELVQAPHGRPEFWDLLKDAEFYIGAGQFKHGPEFYAQAPKLKLVQTLSAGYNTYDLDAARNAGVPICNNGGANATAVAEHAVMLMLAVSRRLMWQHDGVVSGRWRGNDFNSTKLYELEDKTLGIVGLGNIGKKVARRAKAFDMRIQYYDVNRMTTDQEDALGVRFAYDDFGAGQARLNELGEVPPHFVKFDMALVNGLASAGERKQRVVSDLVRLVADLGSISLAEGLEASADAEVCRQMGFRLMQGYLFGKPITVDTF